MKAVLWNFLGAFTSRYSEFDGYWLFGFLVKDLGELRIDLLTPDVGAGGGESPREAAMRTATTRFDDQLRKAGIARARIVSASLIMRKLPEPVWVSVGMQKRTGHLIAFEAAAQLQDGHHYEQRLSVAVAPHDGAIEMRSRSTVDR